MHGHDRRSGVFYCGGREGEGAELDDVADRLYIVKS